MGDSAGWQRSSRRIFTRTWPSRRVLWAVDTGWPLLLFPEFERFDTKRLGDAESTGLFHRRSVVPVPLTTGPLSFDALAVSPDGRKLFVDAAQGRAELVRYDRQAQQFVPFLSGISAGELDFSRDRKWITYASYPDASIWRCSAEGSDRVQLTYPPSEAGLPRWSPDGTQIAYTNALPGRPLRFS